MRETERKLGESEQRIKGLTTVSDSLRATLTTTIDNYRAVIEEQKATIVALTDQVAQLSDTVALLKEMNNTVYYIIGTKSDLLHKGIIMETGGSRFPLIFSKTGETIVPARELESLGLHEDQQAGRDRNSAAGIGQVIPHRVAAGPGWARDATLGWPPRRCSEDREPRQVLVDFEVPDRHRELSVA